jgi:nicotinamidase-related amidase
MIDRQNSLLMVVDIQERLLPVIFNQDEVLNNTVRLLKIADFLSLPVLITEQYPKGLGPSHSRLIEALGDSKPEIMEKITFSALGQDKIKNFIKPFGSVILCGIECHVCVCQTALEILNAGLECHIISDCTGSRSEMNYNLGLKRMEREGAVISSTEMLSFELMKSASFENFKAISTLIKEI